MTLVFKCRDPRGRTVLLTDDVWEGHILIKRAWMREGWLSEVRAALEGPLGIYATLGDPDDHIYYRMVTMRGKYLKVVVRFDKQETGRVVAAYPVSNMPSGEKWIWPVSSR